MPSGSSDWAVSGCTSALGLKGTAPQPSTPTGVWVWVRDTCPSHDCTSRYVVVVLEQALGSVRKLPCPARPLKISLDFRTDRGTFAPSSSPSLGTLSI